MRMKNLEWEYSTGNDGHTDGAVCRLNGIIIGKIRKTCGRWFYGLHGADSLTDSKKTLTKARRALEKEIMIWVNGIWR